VQHTERRDIFISYAAEDAQAIARPLVKELEKRGVTVWFAEHQLIAGHSLRRQIDAGLKHSRLGVVVLSRHFFSKHWPQRELDGLTAREMAGEAGVIVPVWHKIEEKDVREYSAPLAALFALESRHGIKRIADGIEQALEVNKGLPREKAGQPFATPIKVPPGLKLATLALLGIAVALVIAWLIQRSLNDRPGTKTESDNPRIAASQSGSSLKDAKSLRDSPASPVEGSNARDLERLGAHPNGAPISPNVRIKVVKFFMPGIGLGRPDVRNEYQLKIKPRVINLSQHDVDISAGPSSSLALAIPARGNKREWLSSADPPYRYWNGLLLIPPNPDAAIALEYEVEPGRVSRSYATHWPFEILQPDGVAFQTSYKSGSTVVKRGDLVFSIPRTTYSRSGPMALVYKTPGHQPYVGPGAFPDDWGRPQYPDFF
jgi:TIR domain